MANFAIAIPLWQGQHPLLEASSPLKGMVAWLDAAQ
jgi:hypothetical protein